MGTVTVLPAEHRLVDPADFRRAARRGRRGGSRTLTAHVLVNSDQSGRVSEDAGAPARVGLAVSKSVGNAVTRNRVKRRLRHAMRGHLPHMPADSLVVLRAKPGAGSASYALLAGDLDRALERCAVTSPTAPTSPGAA